MKSTRRGGPRVTGVLLAVLLAAGTAQAGQLLDVNLVSRGGSAKFAGEKVQTDRGFGWRSGSTEDGRPGNDHISYRITPGADIKPESGSIEVSVQRSRDGGPEWDGGSTYNTLFALLGPNDEKLLAASVLWKFRGDHSVSGLFVDSDIPQVREKLWGSWIPFERRIDLGEWVDLTFTWGGGKAAILVNGEEVGAYYRDWDGMAKKPVHPIVPGGIDLAPHLQKAQELVVGSDVDYGTSGRPGGRRYSTGLYNSVLGRLVITDGAAGAAAPAIVSVESNAARVAGFSGKLVAGNDLTVTLRGTPGAAASFDLAHYPDLGGNLTLDWRGWGVYLEEKTFFDAGEVDLRDVEGYRVFIGTEPLGDVPGSREPAAELEVGEQSHTFELLSADTPYYVGVYAAMRDGSLRPVIAPRAGLPMTETAPGVYRGTLTVGYADRYARAVFVGRLGRGGASASLVAADDPFAVDPALNVSVATEPSVLRADEKSTAKVTVTVTDANGKAVGGHRIRFLLATTSTYTGVVGGGAFAKQVGGAIRTSAFEGTTDIFGRLTTTYVAGFAAKTAIIVARDMESNDTGAGSVRTYIQGIAELQLEPVERALAAAGYELTVTSSDSWLTADGKSQARITAALSLYGQPVEGHRIAFSVSAGGGSIRAVSDVTDRSGLARAVYTAGTRIGMVIVTATDRAVEASGSVPIELRSDAPAKIGITVTPERLPADGRSRAELAVVVTDINDNPNEGAVVEYRIEEGGGSLRDDDSTTDRRGESATTYTAGNAPGRVQIIVTVRSSVPAEEELQAARGMALSVQDPDFY